MVINVTAGYYLIPRPCQDFPQAVNFYFRVGFIILKQDVMFIDVLTKSGLSFQFYTKMFYIF